MKEKRTQNGRKTFSGDLKTAEAVGRWLAPTYREVEQDNGDTRPASHHLSRIVAYRFLYGRRVSTSILDTMVRFATFS